MAFTAKVLAEGQLPTAKGTLYTVPASTKAFVKFFSLFNTNAAAQTIIIYAKKSTGTSKVIGRCVLQENEGARVIEIGEAVNLEAGDTIEGVTTTATAVDYFITGAEET